MQWWAALGGLHMYVVCSKVRCGNLASSRKGRQEAGVWVLRTFVRE